ncbi:hypothetical protein FACS1894190_15140 [Spirochaetia bacterium]|nr:hypothetical protein FACS1894190_15140 [Spirochaetia bacterium]
MREKIKVGGMVTVRVLDKDGNVKRNKPTFFRRMLHIGGKPLVSKHHNIVTRTGDALIADALLLNPNKTKVSSASGFIQVGTGWTGNSTKLNTNCNTPTGAAEELDDNYPALKAEWGSTGDTTVCYRATFEAGDLNANGINEAALLNGSGASAACLAYAQITPSVNVTQADTLQVVWEITILGQ